MKRELIFIFAVLMFIFLIGTSPWKARTNIEMVGEEMIFLVDTATGDTLFHIDSTGIYIRFADLDSAHIDTLWVKRFDSLGAYWDTLGQVDSAIYADSAGFLKGILKLYLGYHLGADSIVIENGDTIASPSVGITFVDTSGGDTLKCYLNDTWEVK